MTRKGSTQLSFAFHTFLPVLASSLCVCLKPQGMDAHRAQCGGTEGFCRHAGRWASEWTEWSRVGPGNQGHEGPAVRRRVVGEHMPKVSTVAHFPLRPEHTTPRPRQGPGQRTTGPHSPVGSTSMAAAQMSPRRGVALAFTAALGRAGGHRAWVLLHLTQSHQEARTECLPEPTALPGGMLCASPRRHMPCVHMRVRAEQT